MPILMRLSGDEGRYVRDATWYMMIENDATNGKANV